MAFLNSDIVLLQDFDHAVAHVLAEGPYPYVAVGRRYDMEGVLDLGVTGEENFESHVQMIVRNKTVLHGERGLDYWVFPRSIFDQHIDFPSFLAGVFRWDNYLLSQLIIANVSVIDLTAAVSALHQNGNTVSLPHRLRVGAEYNEILSNKTEDFEFGILSSADYLLEGHCLPPARCRLVPNLSQPANVTELRMRSYGS